MTERRTDTDIAPTGSAGTGDAAIPPSVLAALLTGDDQGGERQPRIERLSDANPVFRVRIGERSWIVKPTRDVRREREAAAVFEAFGVPACEVTPMPEGWVRLGDLSLPTIGERLSAGVDADALRRWMPGLGAAAMHADLVGMRDRNLRNVLIRESDDDAVRDDPPRDAPPTFVLIDYESAFRASLLGRWFRPGDYVCYLVRRLFFDVVREAGTMLGATDDELAAMFEPFVEGVLDEQRRLNAIVSRGGAAKLSVRWTARRYIRSRQRDADALARLVRLAYRHGVSEDWHRADA